MSAEAQSDEQSLGRDVAIGNDRSDFSEPSVDQRSEAQPYHSAPYPRRLRADATTTGSM